MSLPDLMRFEPLSRSLLPACFAPQSNRPWVTKIMEVDTDPTGVMPRYRKIILTHMPTKTRVEAHDTKITLVQVNPAYLYFGHHHGVIKDQAMLDAAMHKVWQLLDPIAPKFEERDRMRLLYLEVGWPFEGELAPLQAQLASCRHEWVRSGPATIVGKSTKFYGTEFALKIYNKLLVLLNSGEILPTGPSKPRTPVIRLEAVFRKKRLIWALHKAGVEPDTLPTHEQLKAILRLALENIDAQMVPSSGGAHSHLAKAVVKLNALNIHPMGMAPFDFMTEGMSAPSKRRLRQVVEATKVEMGQFDVRRLLGPKGTWPPAIDIAA